MSETQKTAVIFGLANKRSIAWAIAQKLQQAGWRLAITYQNARLELEAKDLIAELPGASGFMCDVTQDDQIARLFEELKEKYGILHGLVHSIGFAPESDLKGEFVNTTREGFRVAHDISVYSLIAVAHGALPLMTAGGGIVTLTYYGAEKVVPRYALMGVAKAALEAAVRYVAAEVGPKGIRVHAISPGPLSTRAASGIPEFDELLDKAQSKAPTRSLVSIDDVGAATAFLALDGAKLITGDVMYIDGGYHIID